MTAPRLSALTPDAVAREVTDWATAHLGLLAFSVGLTEPLIAPGGSLAHEVRELVVYAQTGAPMPGGVTARLQTVVDAIYTTAHPDAHQAVDPAAPDTLDEPTRAIDVVLRAALARAAIEDGRRVPLPWLSALSGVPIQTLRQYATPSRGELRTLDEDRTITAREAARWLSGRGVAGYATRGQA